MQSFETSFQQDLNGDGVIGIPAAPPTIVDSPHFVYQGVDANGVQLYSVTWGTLGSHPFAVRVLAPDHPSTDYAHSFLYALPVEGGLAQSTWGSGLDELRQLGVENQYNATIIEPIFPIGPWYADNPLDATIDFETFMATLLPAWVNTNFATSGTEDDLLIGFSKSGYGALDLLFKHPAVFEAAAAWDFPADMTDYSNYGASGNYGTDSNFQNNYRLTGTFIDTWKAPFITQDRIWISGYNVFQTDVADFNTLLTSHGVLHTLLTQTYDAHNWYGGWLRDAVAGLYGLGWTINTTAPTVTEALKNDTGSPSTDKLTSDPTLTGTADAGATVTLKEGTTTLGTTTADTKGTWSFTPTGLSEGQHTIIASETNAAGNAGTASLTFTLDTIAPDTSITSQPASLTNSTSASFTVQGGDASGDTFQYKLDNAANWTSTTSSTISFTGLSDGGHTFQVAAIDAAGNVDQAPASFTWTISTAAPSLTEALKNDTGSPSTDKLTSDPTLTGTADAGATVTLKEGTTTLGTTTADTKGTWSFTPTGLSEGQHTIVASETNAAGNAGTASLTFTLDHTGPTGWQFSLANSNFDGLSAIAAGTVLGTVAATGDPNSSTFAYFFASNASGTTGVTQSSNGLSIDHNTGVLTTTAAISNWPSMWLVTEDVAGNIYSKQLTLRFGTSAGEAISVGSGTMVTFGLGGADAISGTSSIDSIAAGAGNDSIIGFVGADTVNGGAGTDTIVLTATSPDLNAATDARITNVEAISASGSAVGVTIDLHNQTEGFTITGSGFGDTIIGSNGNDKIIGFVGADTVNGGAGTDTIVLTATSPDLNVATDYQILNVEAVSGSTAPGVTIDLHNQTEGFTITGSGFDDIITGGAGADIINAGAGNDIVIGFVGADTVNGGAGTDTIVLTATSPDLNAATDARITNVEAVSASGSARRRDH